MQNSRLNFYPARRKNRNPGWNCGAVIRFVSKTGKPPRPLLYDTRSVRRETPSFLVWMQHRHLCSLPGLTSSSLVRQFETGHRMSDSLARQVLTRAGIFVGKTTRRADLQQLVNDLRVQPIKGALIRIGPAGDGGYLVPDDLEGVRHCFSPGVSDCSEFELDLANRGMEVFMADRSVDGPAADHPRFHFEKKFLASRNSPEDGLVTLDDWYHSSLGPVTAASPDALLQMDIEGAEYEVIHNLSEALLQRFRIIVIEFHRLHQLLDRYSFGWMSSAFRKLLKDHAVVHLHPNNARRTIRHGGLEFPFNMEFTFLRRDCLEPSQRQLVFPHPLDRENVPSRPGLVLPSCWYA